MSLPRTRAALPALLFAALLTVTLGACSGGGGDSGASDSGDTEFAEESAPEGAGTAADSAETDSLASEGSAVDQPGQGTSMVDLAPDQLDQRDIIRTGTVSLVADDPEAVRDRIGDLLNSLGGYVSDESARTRPEGGIDELRIVIQVPTGRFDDAVQKVSGLGEVTSRSIKAEDVTRAVADVDSRVESARAALDRVRALLDRAVSLGTVIRLEGVLSHRQSDLESLLAQQQVLAGQTALGTLEVEVTVPEKEAAAPPPDEPEETGFLAGLGAGWDALTAAFVVGSTAVGALLPFAVLVGALALPALVWHRRRVTLPAAPPQS